MRVFQSSNQTITLINQENKSHFLKVAFYECVSEINLYGAYVGTTIHHEYLVRWQIA